MAEEQSIAGVERLLNFYDARGYRNSVGTGKRPAVIVIDFSNAFTRGTCQFPGGNFAAELSQTRRLLESARSHNVPAFYTTIAYNDPEKESGFWGKKVPWLSHCRIGSDAVAIDPDLGRQVNEPLIIKRFPSAFFDTDLHQRLRTIKVDTLVITGCTTSVCIRATAVDAMQHGYHTLVAKEAVGDLDEALNAVHLRDMDARYADVVAVDQLLNYFEMLPHD